jgi:hypothetical protein
LGRNNRVKPCDCKRSHRIFSIKFKVMCLSVLFRPQWKHPDAKIRGAAVEKLSNQAKLGQIALYDPDNGIRRKAIKKLGDQKILAQIALSDPDEFTRYLATGLIRDMAVLYKLVKTDSGNSVREAAFTNITDENMRLALVKEDSTLKDLHQKLCRHKYLVTGQELDMADLTDEYTLRCTKCNHQVKTHYPKQYM